MVSFYLIVFIVVDVKNLDAFLLVSIVSDSSPLKDGWHFAQFLLRSSSNVFFLAS